MISTGSTSLKENAEEHFLRDSVNSNVLAGRLCRDLDVITSTTTTTTFIVQ